MASLTLTKTVSPTPAEPMVAFSVRSLRVSLRDRLRTLATWRSVKSGTKSSMESVVNEALARGLDAMEATEYAPKPARLPKAGA